jgi:hypothetical protein
MSRSGSPGSSIGRPNSGAASPKARGPLRHGAALPATWQSAWWFPLSITSPAQTRLSREAPGPILGIGRIAGLHLQCFLGPVLPPPRVGLRLLARGLSQVCLAAFAM